MDNSLRIKYNLCIIELTIIKINLLAGRLFCTHACTPWPLIQNGNQLLKANNRKTMFDIL